MGLSIFFSARALSAAVRDAIQLSNDALDGMPFGSFRNFNTSFGSRLKTEALPERQMKYLPFQSMFVSTVWCALMCRTSDFIQDDYQDDYQKYEYWIRH